MPHPSRAPLLALALLAPACVDDPAPADTEATAGETTAEASAGSDETTGEPPHQALYHEDVRPILAEHCGTCHADGAIAPFALDDYAETREWGEALLAAVQARTMPPFAVDNDGTCNTFIDAHWLRDDEIDTIAAWVLAGYPEGDASVPAPTPPAPATLTGAVTELQLPEYTPAPADGGLEDYRCFLVELPIDQPRYVTGFDVLPGSPRMVHHVLGFRVDPQLLGNGATMQALDDLSPDVPGWECYGAAGEDVFPGGVPVTWAPGAGATSFPAGVGVRFDPGNVLVVQVHYDLAQGSELDRTQVHLEMADEVERAAVQVLWDPFLFSAQFGGEPHELPPGQPAAQFTWDESLRDMLALDSSGVAYDDVEILGIIPHMHTRGRTMSIALETDAGMQCGAAVNRWDFDWQRAYFYDQPIPANIDDRLHVTCEWSTLGDEAPVLPGFGTGDEMCLVGLMFTAS
jgi:hypothetical protein